MVLLVYLVVRVKWTKGMEKTKDSCKAYLCVRFYFLLLFGDMGDLGDALPFSSCRSLLTPLIYTDVAF